MSLYRGAGGASDATDDSTVNAVAGYAASAATSATSAATSATASDASSTAAITAANSASASATTATTQATNAATSATNAAASASTATTQASNASTSATNAANSASTASTQSSTAASNASSASTSATAAAASATAAATSKTGADSSAASALAIYANTTAMNAAVATTTTNAATATTQATLATTQATLAAESAVASYDASQIASGFATSAQNSANSAQAYVTSVSGDADEAAASAEEAAASALIAANAASSASAIVGSGNGVFGSTPISTASTVTLSGGTATGIAYLNASKVLTTGTAVTYTPDSSTVQLTDTKLTVTNGSLDGVVAYTDTIAFSGNADNTVDTGIGGYFVGNQYGVQIRSGANTGGAVYSVAADIKNTKGFSSAPVTQIEQAGGNSTGPTLKLSVTGASSTAKALYVASGQADFASDVILSGSSANGVAYLNNSKVVTSDSSLTFNGKNLNLSAAHGAWYTDIKSIEIPGGALWSFNDYSVNFSQNCYTDISGDGRWISANPATIFSQNQGTFAWDIAAGTTPSANGLIPFFTNLMTLNSNGLGVGVANPTAKLDVSGTAKVSGNVTLSGGTANGVGYLNGSKVLTTGSALTFDGSSRFLVNGVRLDIDGGTSADQLRLGTDPNYYKIGRNSSSGPLEFYGTQSGVVSYVFGGVNGEYMRLNSTGLGIGTSSPAQKLSVYSAALDVTGISLQNASTGGHHYVLASAGQNQFYDATAGSFALRDITAGATRFIVDSSGNLGLGVTPSAWGSVIRGLQVGYGASFAGHTSVDIGYMGANFYFDDSANRYIHSAFASRFIVDGNSGGFAWQIAPSGTAGAAISFTQAMTLDASGNLLVGTTSAGGKITAAVADNASFQIAASFTNATNADFNIRIKTSVTDIGCSTETPLTFSTANTERARIDSAGRLLVGTTTEAWTNTNAFIFSPTAGDSSFTHSSSKVNGDAFQWFIYNTGIIGSITQNGTTAVAYNTSSDYRLKNITGPITTSGAYIDSLNPVEGTWKADGSTFVGLIAHEAQEVSRTQVATGTKDGEEMQGMSYSSSEMIANLIAEIQDLRKRLAAAGI